MTEKTLKNYKTILDNMQSGIWYKASEFEGVLSVKETRIKELLTELYEHGEIETEGSTKGKIYKKVDD